MSPEARSPIATRAAEIQDRVVRLIQICLDNDDPIDPNTPLGNLGIDSLAALDLAGRIEDAFGIALDAAVAYDHPNAALLAAYVTEQLHPELKATEGVGATRIGGDLAIIGMALRLPGAIETSEALWDALLDGRDLTAHEPDAAAATRSIGLARAGLLPGAAEFDPAAFGISQPEAKAMTATQRLILTVALEAIEHAAIDIASLAGQRVGVFVGAASGDGAAAGPDQAATPYSVVGTASASLAGRVSFTFGLRGPSIVVDTACSSSLVALHLARQSMLADECDLAIVASANLVGPRSNEGLAAAGALSPTGDSTAYGTTADGYVRGEGAIALLLKPLSVAAGDGDPVIAVLAGSAINHDGRSATMTAPNGVAQTEVIQAALAAAGATARDLLFIEGHGTGTKLGDPIEVGAIARVLAGTERGALPLGSIKSNLGHLEATAGLAGVVKAALALQAGRLPAHRLVGEPSALIRWQAGGVKIAIAPEQLADGGVAGVSSFGLTGTNAHAVLRSGPRRAAAPPASRDIHLLCYSAHSPDALAQLRRSLLDFVHDRPDVSLDDIEHSLIAGRTGLLFRGAIVGSRSRGWRDVPLPLSPMNSRPARRMFHFPPISNALGQPTTAGSVKGQLRRSLDDVTTLVAEHVAMLEEWGVSYDRVSAEGSGIVVAARHFGLIDPAQAVEILAETACAADSRPFARIAAPEQELRALLAALNLSVDLSDHDGDVATVVGEASDLSSVGRICRGLGYGVTVTTCPEPASEGSARLLELADDLARHLGEGNWVESAAPGGLMVDRGPVCSRGEQVQELVFDIVAGTFGTNIAETAITPGSDRGVAALQMVGAAFCGGADIAARPYGRRINLSLRRLASETVPDSDPTVAAVDEQPRAFSLAGGGRSVEWTARADGGVDLAPTPAAAFALLGEGFGNVSADNAAGLFDCEATSLEPLPNGTRLQCSIDGGTVRLAAWLHGRWRVIATGKTRRRPSRDRSMGDPARPVDPAGDLPERWIARASHVRIAPPWNENCGGGAPNGTDMDGLVIRSLAADEQTAIEAPEWLMETVWTARPWPLATPANSAGPDGIITVRLGTASTTVEELTEFCVALQMGIADAAASGKKWIGVHIAVARDTECGVVACALVALTKVAGRELPACRIQVITTELGLDEHDCQSILAAYPAEPSMRYFGGRLEIPTFQPADTGAAGSGPALSGNIVVTGWTGAIGRVVVERLLRDTDAHVLLIARHAAPADRVWLDAYSARVQVDEVDASNTRMLEGVIDVFRRRHGGLTGVIHCAGVVPEAPFGGIERNHLVDAFSARTGGALNLHRLTAQDDLDFFIMCASLAGTFGAPTLGAYAASTAALDGLVAHRRAMGLPASSLAWTTWRGSHLGERGGRWSDYFGSVPDAHAWRLFDIMARDPGASGSFAVAQPGWWQRLPSAIAESLSPRFEQATSSIPVHARHQPRLSGPALEEALLTHAERLAGVAAVRGWKSGIPTLEAGLDSLTLLELHRFIKARGGIELSPTAMLDYPTFRHLSRHLQELAS